MKEDVKNWLSITISTLVSYPQDVTIDIQEDEMGMLYIVKVNKEDNGKIIGKAGNNVNALRILLRAIAIKYDQRASLKIDIPPFSYKKKE